MNSFSTKYPLLFGVILFIVAVLAAGILTGVAAAVGFSTEGGTVIGRLVVAIVLIVLFRTCFHWDKSFSGIALAWPVLIVVAWNVAYHLMSGAELVAPGAILDSILVGLAPGLFEEVLFRGIFIGKLRECGKGVWYTLIASSLFFAAMHLTNIVGMDVANVLVQVLYSLVIGLFLGAVYLASNDIVAVVIAHAAIDISNQIFVTSPSESSVPMIIAFCIVLIILAVYALQVARKTAAEESGR